MTEDWNPTGPTFDVTEAWARGDSLPGGERGLRKLQGSQVGERPLLTKIAKEAEMGGLIYEMPSSPLLTNLRNAEISVFNAFQKKEPAAVQASQESTKEPKEKSGVEKAFLNFCKAHREGHVQGLSRVDHQDLLNSILANAGIKEGQDPKDLAYQAAAVYEAAGDDQSKRDKLTGILAGNSLWQERVVKVKATEGLQIPGITEGEANVFPGAKRLEISKMEQTPLDGVLNPVYDRWRGIVADSTAQRAKDFISQSEPSRVASQIKEAVTSA